MVAYSFKARFAAPILAGTKAQTIRAERAGRSRHARPGEQLQLFTGMRTKACRLLATPPCIAVMPILMVFSWPAACDLVVVDGIQLAPSSMARFARADGFETAADMAAFWAAEHPGIENFQGALIRWQPLVAADALAIAARTA
ncbi:hypothetical protein [uncultured Methylobacterium sp.]|uniref:hypothetical protein n=1 Tax=uncultured Methylobacterium sp. TaxID=157278 RepID=UPI0035C9BCB9